MVDVFHAAFSLTLIFGIVELVVLSRSLLPLEWEFLHNLWPQEAPLWAQILIAGAIIDFGLWFMHWLSHKNQFLWRLHALHHSSERLYWLNGERRHPLSAVLLASPGLLGSSSGAALCAVITLYFGLQSYASWLLPLAGMLGALLATVLVYLIAGQQSSITTLILAGVAVNAACAAGISLAINLAPSPYAVSEIALWLLGDLSKTSLDGLALMLPTTLLGWGLLMGCGRGLNALSLGEQTARSMGINLNRLRWQLFLATALAIGAAVATVGSIGFIGLVVPHLLRPLVGHEPARLLPASALGGAVMLLLADIGVRLIDTQTPLQVGVLTALVGAPFFLYLIIKSRRSMT